jgi:2-C-methyl-D-erythritol 2,4-cyclodiphosphate synthase
VRDLLQEKGYAVGNVDLTLLAERPKIAPHLDAMRASIAEDLRISTDAVGLKATTNERVGAVGREEAIAALATALLLRV